MMKSVTLNNGIEMPDLVCGTWTYDDEEAYRCIKDAIDLGYRAFDTAAYYGNEAGVGKAVRQCGVPREKLFIQSKVWKTECGYEKGKAAVLASLDRLGLDYIDLMLIHWPQVKTEREDWKEQNLSTWNALEELYRDGIVKAVGTCNFFVEHLTSLYHDISVKPMIDQIEMHPGFLKMDVIRHCHENGIVVQAWSPMGRGEALRNETICSIAERHAASASDIILQWVRYHRVVPIVKARNKEHLRQNLEPSEFLLTEEEIRCIDEIPFFGKLGYDPNQIAFDDKKTNGVLFSARKQ